VRTVVKVKNLVLTSNSDFYFSIQDAGINRVVRHVMRQRPSLFNYGTSFVLRRPELLCRRIDVAPEVLQSGNPLITVLDPLPVIGTNLGLNYCVQLTRGEIDFHPENIIALPSELHPLAAQRLGVHFQVCAGIGCPTGRLPLPGKFSSSVLTAARMSTSKVSSVDAIQNPVEGSVALPGKETVVIPTSKLECFCIDLYATAGAKITGSAGNQTIIPTVDGIEIVDLKPEGLENSIECYALLALNQGIIPPLSSSISNLAFGLIDLPDNMGSLRVSGSTTVPNNPAIEQDQLKVFINLDQIELDIHIDPIDCQLPSGGNGPTITRTSRARTRTGTFDLTAAISQKAFEKIFAGVVKGFKLNCADGGSFGPFSANYNVAAHLDGGSVDLRSNGTIKVSELDIKWDTLSLNLCIDIPKVCTPGGCIIPIPFDGCALDVPSYCFFSGNPDFCIPLNLSSLLTSEISFTAGIQVFYGTSPGLPNRWQIVIVPTLPFDLDIIDIADTVGDLVENAVDAAIDGLLSGFPDWAKDVFKFLFGPLDDFIRFALDIPDDVGEWILDALTDLGVFDVLLSALNGFLTTLVPPLEIEDPLPILPAENGLIPVKLPIEFIGIKIDSDEMTIEGDIGN
jgi:hypothetical protein